MAAVGVSGQQPPPISARNGHPTMDIQGLEDTAGRSPEDATCGLTCSFPFSQCLGVAWDSPGACPGWLPAWFPGTSLAGLTFERPRWRQASFDAGHQVFPAPWPLGDCPANLGNNDISSATTAP
jgi:hypothetical protein